MKVTRVSQLTGKENTMELNVTKEQMTRFINGEGYIQTIFPNLSPEEREFLKSGITPQEWNEMFGN